MRAGAVIRSITVCVINYEDFTLVFKQDYSEQSTDLPK